LAFLIPANAEDLQEEYDQLRKEVENHSSELARTPHCVVITKVDLFPPDASFPEILAPDAWGVFTISSITRVGLAPLLEGLYARSHLTLKEEGPEEEEWWVPE
jgi:GTPase involved in cell partitioning and DNA repair